MADTPVVRHYYAGRIIQGRCRIYGPTELGEQLVLPCRYGRKAWCSWGSDSEGTRGTAIALLQHYLLHLGRGDRYARNWDAHLRFYARTHAGRFAELIMSRMPAQWNLYLPALEEFFALCATEAACGEAAWDAYARAVFEGGWLEVIPLEVPPNDN